MSSTIGTAHEATQRAAWVECYRHLTVDELIARTLSLRIATKRGHATDSELRFQVLEAEQARRAEWVMAASADSEAARLIGSRTW